MMKKPTLLHPEHLLDLARRGPLAPPERRHLAAHLAICDVCAWEQSATDDFARELATVEIDPSRLSALVDTTLSRAGLSSRARPSRTRWLAASAVAAAVLGALALPSREPQRDSFNAAPLASTEASLDAGALGTPSGGDS